MCKCINYLYYKDSILWKCNHLLNLIFPVIVCFYKKSQHIPDDIVINWFKEINSCLHSTQFVFQLLVMTVISSPSPSYHDLCPPSPPPQENKVSSAALFHTSLAIFFTEQDLQLFRAPHQLEKCYANVPVVCEKWRGGEAFLSRTLIHSLC